MHIRAVSAATLLSLTLAACGPTLVFAQEGFGPARWCFGAVPENIDDAVEPLHEARRCGGDAERALRGRHQADARGDGVPDRSDLCRDARDPVQEDGDGVGDACECFREFWPGLVVEPMGPGFVSGRAESGAVGHAPEAAAVGCDATPWGDGHRRAAWMALLALGVARRRGQPPPHP